MSDQEKIDQVPTLPPMQEPITGGRGDVSWKDYSNQWNENHGTALMVFAGLILAVGSGWIFYQQNRFRPVAFPSADAIQSVRTELIDVGIPGSLDSASFLGSDAETQSGMEPKAMNADGVSEERESIIVRVTGAVDTKGMIRLAIYRSSEHFNDSEKADWKGGFSIGPDMIAKCQIPLDALAGQFAVAGFHDANNNGELDRNAIGIPTERYGFSNAARGKLGSPAFDEAVMDRSKANGPIDLKIW